MRTKVVVAALAVLLTACGTESVELDVADKAEQDAQLAFARCLREEGIEVRDPRPGERGLDFAQAPPGLDEATTDRVREDCKAKLGSELGPLQDLEDPQSQDRLFAYAQCMRQGGVDMPDPDFSNPRGGPGLFMRQNADWDDPDFVEADDGCRADVFGHRDGGPAGDQKAEALSRPEPPELSPPAR